MLSLMLSLKLLVIIPCHLLKASIKPVTVIVVLNPLETSLHKRKSIRKVKTDPRDTFRIAKVYYMNNYNYYHPVPKEILELKHLSRQWNSLNNTFVDFKLKFLSTLDLTLPNYKSIFFKPCCKYLFIYLRGLSYSLVTSCC